LPGWLRFAALAAALGMTTAVVAPVDAAIAPTSSVPAVCAYLGVINGTRTIDPGFAPSSPSAPSPPAAGSLGAGAVLLATGTSTTDGTSTTEDIGASAPAKTGTASNYCHALPPLAPLGAGGFPPARP
jgi:hypothetical protein